MHASGVTCIDWSSRGAGWGFLGDSFDAFVVFLIERLMEEEDLIFIECTELFDWLGFIEMFLAFYVVHIFKFLPRHCGVPVHRLRVYLALFKTSTITMTSSVLPLDDGAFFKANFSETTLMSGSDMLRAPRFLWKRHFLKRLSAWGSHADCPVASVRTKNMSWEQLKGAG